MNEGNLEQKLNKWIWTGIAFYFSHFLEKMNRGINISFRIVK